LGIEGEESEIEKGDGSDKRVIKSEREGIGRTR